MKRSFPLFLVAGLSGFALSAASCGDDAKTTSTATSTSSATTSSSSSSSSSGTGGSGGASTGPTVMTADGEVEGVLVGKTREFLGIPYAAPPVGPLRWKPPAPATKWTTKLAAKKVGAFCPQTAPLTNVYMKDASEDCLTINVFTPDKPASSALPVLAWIHGGGFVLGSGNEPLYDGQKLSEATGAIVVAFNYRLGPLGYLALPDLAAEDAAHPSTGDYGMEDQRAALAWVKTNAAAFGGDPMSITAFGESAGGISVGHHLLSPKSKGLFTRAILESGPPDAIQSMNAAVTQGAALVQALGCQGAGVLDCMRGKDTKAVIEALPLPKDLVFSPGAKWFPVVDGWNIPDMPEKLIADGKVEPMPTIFGTNADEGTLFMFLGNVTIADDAAFTMFADTLAPGHGAEIVTQYPSATYGSSQKAAAAALSDATFACPTRRFARAMVKTAAPTFLYHFTYVAKKPLFPGLGAFHSSEVPYVFGNTSQLLPQPLDASEQQLSAQIMGYWGRFAAKKDPNGGTAFMWPAYTLAADESLVLDLTVSKETALLKAGCDFWDTVPLPIP